MAKPHLFAQRDYNICVCVANFGHSRFALGISLSRPRKVLLKLVSSWHLVCHHILASASFTVFFLVCLFYFFF